MGQYLDDNGLRYLWTKIKNIFVAKESGKGLSSNDYTTTEKNKLAGIANNANNYSLPTASASTLGGIKVGSGLSISNGVLSASGGNYLSVIHENTITITDYSSHIIAFNKQAIFVMVQGGPDSERSQNITALWPGGSYRIYYQSGYSYVEGTVSFSKDGNSLSYNSDDIGTSFYYKAIG